MNLTSQRGQSILIGQVESRKFTVYQLEMGKYKEKVNRTGERKREFEG